MDDGIVRMGEVVFSQPGAPTLRALGLGSCVALCVFDPAVKLGCMAHIMLPEARDPDTCDLGRYADTAVPYVIEQMTAKGAVKSRLRAAIAGGAQLFHVEGAPMHLDVGRRNAELVKQHLAESKLRLVAEDVGNSYGRTVVFDVSTGAVTVKQVGGVERRLADL